MPAAKNQTPELDASDKDFVDQGKAYNTRLGCALLFKHFQIHG